MLLSTFYSRETQMESIREVLQIIDGLGKMCHLQINQIAHLTGLSEVQVIILREIQIAESINVAQLVKVSSLSIYKLNVQTNYLLRKNLITRKQDPNDKRAWILSISDEGRRVLESSSVVREKIMHKFNFLPEQEQDQILSAFQQMARLISE